MIEPEKSHHALPSELLPHPKAETEWWFYAGHLRSGSRRFAFHFSYFRRLCGNMRVAGVFPTSLLHRNIRFAHLSFTEFGGDTFHYAQRRFPGLGSFGAGESKTGLHLRIGPWLVQADQQSHRIHAVMRGIDLDLDLTPLKPLVRHGTGDGFTLKGANSTSHHVSFTRSRAQGTITLRGECLHATGDAWIDREHGSFRLGPDFAGWHWFSIQFDDGCELMVYDLHDHRASSTIRPIVTWIEADGEVRRFSDEDLIIDPTHWWTSPVSQICYPVAWALTIPGIDLDLLATSWLDCHELDARPSSGMFYSESPIEVTGTRNGHPTSGRGFAERTNPPPRKLTGLYDFQRENLGFRDWLTDDLLLPLRCRGTTVRGEQVSEKHLPPPNSPRP